MREVAASYGVARSWVYELVTRYRAEGDAAFEPRSRRPKTSPRALPDTTVELILQTRRELTSYGLDGGPETIAWTLKQHHGLRVGTTTIHRYLRRAGVVTTQPQKRPRSSYLRFEADQPNEMWQADFTHYPLTTGTDSEILSWLDDHARYALSITAQVPIILLVADLDIRIIHATTGELLRHLTLDPTRDYQPLGRPPGPPPQKPQQPDPN